jgi:hypothetical protein
MTSASRRKVQDTQTKLARRLGLSQLGAMKQADSQSAAYASAELGGLVLSAALQLAKHLLHPADSLAHKIRAHRLSEIMQAHCRAAAAAVQRGSGHDWSSRLSCNRHTN